MGKGEARNVWSGTSKDKTPVLILEEASLELLPKKLRTHENARRVQQSFGVVPEMQILDANFHRAAMSLLHQESNHEQEKRGRPDVVHFALLDATSTPLFIEDRITVAIRARNGDTIILKKGTRPPRTLQRFCGVMARLLLPGKNEKPREDSLFEVVRNMSFPELIEFLEVDTVVSFTRLGNKEPSLREIALRGKETKTAFVVGAFPHGHFRSEVMESSDIVASISDKPLAAHVVTARLCYELERKF